MAVSYLANCYESTWNQREDLRDTSDNPIPDNHNQQSV